jgi:hypothetical protein
VVVAWVAIKFVFQSLFFRVVLVSQFGFTAQEEKESRKEQSTG